MQRTSTLLEAAYAVSRLLLQERDLASLLQGVCDRLTGEHLSQAALLVLLDQESGGVITAETGLDERSRPLMTGLREGRLPSCGVQALAAAAGEAVVCSECDCGLCGGDSAQQGSLGLSAAVRCNPSLSGFLTLQLPPSVQPTAVECRIVADLADSIGLALRQLFADEAAKQREQELERIEERYELALHASQAGLWDWNIRTGEMYTSPDHWELLDYQAGAKEMAVPQRFIHPDDRDRVLAVLNEHLAGTTEEYRIEYRVREKSGDWTWFLDRGQVVERDDNNMPVRMTGTHQNITLQKKQDQAIAVVQQQLHEAVNYERNFLQTVIDSAGDPVMVIDLEFNLLLINQAAARLVQGNGDIASMQGQKCYRLFCGAETPCQDLRFPCPVAQVKTDGRQTKLIHNPYHGNGVNNTFELEVSPLKDNQGALYGIIEVARDVTDRLRIEKELRDSQSHLYRLAHHDALTGLPNRLLFRDRFAQAVSKAERNRNGVAVLFLDLDRFKTVNDTLGHDVGDALLVEVAARLQRQCRQSDTVARFGGDEFVFILESINDRKDAAVVADKIMAALSLPVHAKGNEINVTTSIGIALYPHDAATVDEVIKCADLALYEAKEIGRSNYQFYRQGISQSGQRPRLGEQQFRAAMETGELSVDYLPRFALQNGALAGFEARLRWRHPQMGLLLPEAFIAAADECGMLGLVSEWTLHEICRNLDGWRQAGLRLLPATLHIGSRQLREVDFLPLLERVLAHAPLTAEWLVLELREGVVTEAAGQTLDCIEQIDRLGLGLAVNDFGAGQSSLSRLQRLPLRCLTMSRELVAGVPTEPANCTLAAAIIALGHALGARVLADGVDQEAQRDFLAGHGCDQMQGPLVSAALSRDQVASLLAEFPKGG
jgi:diguanylate cyclase (GGDEF)-like protein/PAS domain S-box-containing protein